MDTKTDTLRTSLHATDSAPKLARTLTTAQLKKWDLTDMADDVRLIVSELMTNAIHETPGQEIRFRLTHHGPLVMAAVWDRSRKCPVVREHPMNPHPESPGIGRDPTDDERGRGLVLVQSVAADWGHGIEPCGGKWVWAIVQR